MSPWVPSAVGLGAQRRARDTRPLTPAREPPLGSQWRCPGQGRHRLGALWHHGDGGVQMKACTPKPRPSVEPLRPMAHNQRPLPRAAEAACPCLVGLQLRPLWEPSGGLGEAHAERVP